MNYDAQALTIRSSNFDIPAQLIVPPQTDQAMRLPALVVLHDIDGPDEVTRRAMERLANWGYVALSLNLFAASGGPKDNSLTALQDFAFSLSNPRVINDVLAAVQWLAEQESVDSAQLGVLGLGWGGAQALMAAAHDARLRVAIDIGGVITYPVLTANQSGSPLNFVGNIEGALFAAFPGADPAFARNEIERLEARLQEHDRRGEIKVYAEAPPRFWRDENLPQTVSLWRRIQSFLEDNIAQDEAWSEGYPNEESRIHA